MSTATTISQSGRRPPIDQGVTEHLAGLARPIRAVGLGGQDRDRGRPTPCPATKKTIQYIVGESARRERDDAERGRP